MRLGGIGLWQRNLCESTRLRVLRYLHILGMDQERADRLLRAGYCHQCSASKWRKTMTNKIATKKKQRPKRMGRKAKKPSRLLIRFAIHLEDYSLPKVPARPHGPLFHRWLPDGQSDAAILGTGVSGVTLKVWFERFGFADGDGIIRFKYNEKSVPPENIPKQAVLDAGPLFGLVEITTPSTAEISALKGAKIGSATFKSLGKRVATEIIQPCVSRFLSILRTNFGQYWLRELHSWDSRDESLGHYCEMLNMRWSLDDGTTWSNFTPDQAISHHTVTLRRSFDEYLTKENWYEITDSFNNAYDPPQASHLLAQAHRSDDQGNLAYALVEAVTALEVAVAEAIRSGVKSKELTGAIQSFWTLPLPAQVVMVAGLVRGISEKDIRDSIQAIKVRNAIVHEGLKPSDEARKYLHGVFRTIGGLQGGPVFRFPSANPGNAVMSVEKWNQQTQES